MQKYGKTLRHRRFFPIFCNFAHKFNTQEPLFNKISMKYFEIDFTLTPCSQDAQDVLSALLGATGCESFEETPTGLKAYIQQSFYDEDALRQTVEEFPFDAVSIIYKVREAEDRDWNEQWEQEGFEPIEVRSKKDDGRCLLIHDGRHIDSSLLHLPSTIAIEIDAHLAFGTGTHETTRMICATLLELSHTPRLSSHTTVLDCGSGTGILGICALKLGAASCLAYDIDEWSADNTRHNAVINRVDDRLTALCGDSAVLDSDSTVLGGQTAENSATTPAGSPAGFSLVLANINRNILLQDLPRFVSVMEPGATLILSGFYESDCALLESKAQTLGLSLTATKTDGDWACMVCYK